MKKKVLIVCGGISEEHEISLISAHSVLQALDRTRFDPLVIGISKEGRWHYEQPESFFLGEPRADKIRLNTSAPAVQVQPFPAGQGCGRLMVEGTAIDFDVAFPLLHGQGGEDGTIQGLFELMGVAYVGSAVGGSWLCMDKVASKELCRAAGLAVADFVVLNNEAEAATKQLSLSKLGFPCFVKPSRTGSSVGISKVEKQSDLAAAVKEAFRHDSKVLVEKGIAAREIECAVLGTPENPEVAELGEVIPKSSVGWYSYEAKYLMDDGAELKVPASLSGEQKSEAQRLAVQTYRLLECYGLARVDLFLEKGTNRWLVNEVNTIPGFTPMSMYPRMWLKSGRTYAELIAELITLALRRQELSFRP